MKPAFALDFRNDAIGLLHRISGGWHRVGSVAVTEPDLAQAMSFMRSTALGLSPHGIATKLILPDDQILYTRVFAPGPDDTARETQIRAALVGRTPYDIDDLVFDWRADGDEAVVAVIARDTLAEAEAFASEHRLNPISFVGAPATGDFSGEVWFGPSVLAASLLAKGEGVEPDAAAVEIAHRGYDKPDAAETAAELPPEAEVEEIAVEPDQVVTNPEPTITPPDFSEPRAPAPDLPGPDAQPDWAFQPEPQGLHLNEAEFHPEPVYSEPAEIEVPRRAFHELEPEEILDADPDQAVGAGVQNFPMADAPIAPEMAAALSQIVLEEAPMAEDVEQDEPEDDASADQAVGPAQVLVTDPGIIEERSPITTDTPPAMGFASRRAAESSGAPSLGAALAAPRAPVERPSVARPLPPTPPKVERPVVARPAMAAPKAASKDRKSGFRGLGALVTAPGIAGSTKRKNPVLPIASAAPAAAPAKPQPAPSRSFGGINARKSAPVRGKPRYLGLIMTAVLLLVLALIAAWSTSLAFRDEGQTGTETATAPDAPTDELPAPEDEMLADMQDPEALAADRALSEGETGSAVTTAAPDAPLPVTTDGTPAPVPSEDKQDEIFLAAMDQAPAAPDPLSLPEPDARGDPQPVAQVAPPPFGTVYQFDANGLIVPTPNGIITPEGVRLFAGKPPVVPTSRPESVRAAAAAISGADPASVLPEALATDQPFPSDPALSQFRPKARPQGLAPVAPDDASLAPAADSRFASLRPKARPVAIIAAGDAARAASAAASLTAQGQAATETAALVTPTSKMAVAISRKPEARPRDLSRAVEAAVAAATRAPEPEPEPAPKGNGKDEAHEADDEPELASASPRIPSNASVAKQATFKNAINLGKTNLIGVYGTNSKRYAMIRTENGRYKKVKVGDKIDGGKIQAITANEVRYQKGSRLVTLAMPKG